MNILSHKALTIFKKRSVYTMILLFIATLCCALCILFSLIFVRAHMKSAIKNHIETSTAYLNTIVSNTNYLASSLQQSLTQLSYTQNIFSLAFKQTIDINSISRAKSDIALASAHNMLIDSAFIYLPKQDMIINSSYQRYRLEEFPGASYISAYENGVEGFSLISQSGTTATLYQYDGRHFITQDYPLKNENKLITINYIINTHEIYRLLTDDLAPSTQLWVFDAFDNPVFYNEGTYPEFLTPEFLVQLSQEEDMHQYQNHSHYFMNVSNVTGWKYVYVTDDSYRNLSVSSVVSPLLLIVLITTAVACLILIAISSFLNRPLKKLLQAIGKDSGNTGQMAATKNEFDYLSQVFTEMSGRQSRLDGMLQNVSQDVLTRFFMNLLSGSQISYSTANETLANISSPFKAAAPYVACAVEISEDLSLAERQHLSFLAGLNSCLDSFYTESGAHGCLFPLSNRSFALVLIFPDDTPILKIRHCLGDLREAVKSLSSKSGGSVFFGAGHIYHSVLDVGFSYSEAHKKIVLKIQEAQSRQDAGSREPEPLPAAAVSFDTRVSQLLSLIDSNDGDGAQLLSQRILKEIMDLTPRLEPQIVSCKYFISTFIDQIASQEKYVNLITLDDNQLSLDQLFTDITSSEDLFEKVNAFCLDLIGELSKIYKRQQNRFILAAQNYIEQHYSDSNLSLSYVADAIGINQSYLSRLFNTTLGVKFTDYLNRYRIEYSLKLLAESDVNINDIAARTGFSSVQNYIRVFKKYMKMTPGQYRGNYKI